MTCLSVPPIQGKTQADSNQFESDGDIIRCGDNGRVGKRKETVPFSPCQYNLLRGEDWEWVREKIQMEDLKLSVSKIACGMGWEG